MYQNTRSQDSVNSAPPAVCTAAMFEQMTREILMWKNQWNLLHISFPKWWLSELRHHVVP